MLSLSSFAPVSSPSHVLCPTLCPTCISPLLFVARGHVLFPFSSLAHGPPVFTDRTVHFTVPCRVNSLLLQFGLPFPRAMTRSSIGGLSPLPVCFHLRLPLYPLCISSSFRRHVPCFPTAVLLRPVLRTIPTVVLSCVRCSCFLPLTRSMQEPALSP